MFFELFQDLSLLGFFIFTFVVLFLAFEGGVILGKMHRSISEPKDRSPIGSIVAATLGLLGFLLAFTFGISASKFDDRRLLVLDEANAIRTTYLRAGYLPNPYQSNIKTLLKEYVSLRLNAPKSRNIEQAVRDSEDLQDRLWQQAVILAEKNLDSQLFGLFIESLNQVITMHAKRVNLGIYIRLPNIIWIALFIITILSIGTVGYQIGLVNARYFGISMLLILTFSSVIVLIADLDSPQEGFIQVSQRSLLDLSDQFDRKSTSQDQSP